MALLAPERHERILTRLREHGTITVHAIADELAVTKETIRRDLDQLESEGALRRVHGGAVVNSASSRSETSWRERWEYHSAEKKAIAQAALEHMPPAESGSVVMDAGTSTESLADLLAAEVHHKGELSPARYLITNAVPIARKLSDIASIDVEVLGGRMRSITGAVVGEHAVKTLARRQADVAFIGTNGVSADFGLSTPDAAEAEVKSALIRAARKVVLLADASKLDQATLVQFGTLQDLDVLITDAQPSDSLAQALKDAEVELTVVDVS